jgi:hypothetical protein
MQQRLRNRYWVELVGAVVSGWAFVLTLAVPEWIEAVLHYRPGRRQRLGGVGRGRRHGRRKSGVRGCRSLRVAPRKGRVRLTTQL